MPVTIEGEQYFTNSEVSDQLQVSRQTLWRWREKGTIPAGLRYRTRQVLFTADEVEAIRQFANKLEPIELGGSGTGRQLGLFGRRSRQEET
jgi:predicted DNA-binding transcriptional regulator AlpA